MDEGMDTGRILLQATEAVDPDDDAGALGDRLAAVGARLLVDTVDRLVSGTVEEAEQDESLATYAAKLSAEDRWLDWSRPAEELARRIRALSPEPAASARFRGDVLKVFRATVHEGEGEPGTVLATGPEGFLVATGAGALGPTEVAPAGRKRMDGAAFVRGYRPDIGERLG
jgi:methionyl-tRNA formyltransferase